jgi:hypothetical protein
MNQEDMARELRRYLMAIVKLFERQFGVSLDVDIQVTVRTPPR